MLRTAAKAFGAVFLLIGVLGFIPALTPDDHLLGIFHVNGVHNIIHLASGAVALACGLSSTKASRLYFQAFGIVYGLVTILGFVYGDKDILGLVANNVGDIILHLAITAAALTLGFGPFDKNESPAAS